MTIDRIPSILFTTFSKLSILDAQNVKIQKIESHDFLHAETVDTLFLANNEIKKLVQRQFVHLTNVANIVLTNNQITTIEDGAFDDISEKLNELNLSHNQILVFKEDHLLTLSMRTKKFNLFLKLSFNNMQTFVPSTRNATGNETKIRLVKLNDNNLVNLTLLKGEIYELNVQNNRLLKLEVNAVEKINAMNNSIQDFRITNRTTFLDLEGNHISHLSWDENISELVYVYLSRNFLTLENTKYFVKKLRKVTYLDLSFNPSLGDDFLAVDTFSELIDVYSISLSNIGLTKIPIDAFANQFDLENLNISQNNINDIDIQSFSRLLNLVTLDLSDNNISKIDDYDKLNFFMPRLNYIGLHGNNWNCAYLQKLKKNLDAQRIALLVSKNKVKNEINFMNIKCRKENFENNSSVDETGNLNNNNNNAILSELSQQMRIIANLMIFLIISIILLFVVFVARNINDFVKWKEFLMEKTFRRNSSMSVPLTENNSIRL